jgi:hypothetical protein
MGYSTDARPKMERSNILERCQTVALMPRSFQLPVTVVRGIHPAPVGPLGTLTTGN